MFLPVRLTTIVWVIAVFINAVELALLKYKIPALYYVVIGDRD